MRRLTVALAIAFVVNAGCSPAAPAADGGRIPAATVEAPAPTAAPTAPSPIAASPVPTAPAVAAPAPSPSPSLARAVASPVAVAASPSAAPAAAQGDGSHYPGPFFLGRADAPVTLEEYSDFQ